jgi:hypothetical protein
MVMTVMSLLVIAAFIVVILSAIGRAPLWVAVLLLCLIELLRIVPIGR